MSGGAAANESGLTWEGWVRNMANLQGFSVLNHRERETCEILIPERRIVWTHVPYKTIFHNTKSQSPAKTSTEYVVESGSEQARIECKWQGVSGSVDEKYPFMFLNAVLTMTEPTVILALGGSYFEEGRGREVYKWLENACLKPPEWLAEDVRASMMKREIRVLNPNSFAGWFRKRFPKA